ncbi:transmembrane 7 superfamily member 3-like [Mizuhopecten yessoensis]|uniref:Transmembrane 7 superfamily member 3 n=1 Tax=Mizuhopecten yessoensis TaxID=6573 RepID=A0A210PYX2_MIZYE|nr:transmembrane 7 superfamily member 3-like [Mizuhopecten yessoensis]OWF41690.1 Transmembrane 7 superfamily member 3 [Mizuhopecten yessoensis]
MERVTAVVTILVLTSLISGSLCQNHYHEVNADLKPAKPSVIKVQGNSRVNLTIKSIPVDTTHVVCQLHTHKDPLSLSLSPTLSPDVTETETDMGVTTLLSKNQKDMFWYLKSDHNHTVEALVTVILYTWKDPIPGGCNSEYTFENDPSFHLSFDSSKTKTKFQWSSHWRNRSTNPGPDDCEHLSNPLQYDMYVYYLPGGDFSQEKHFDGIQKMMTVADVLQNGKKISNIKDDKTTTVSEFTITSYTGQGTIYNVIVTDTSTGVVSRAAYIPTTTYVCDLNNTDSCHMIGSGGKVLAVIGGVLGLFFIILGHRFFKTSTFLAPFLGFGLISVILFERFTTQSILVVLVLSAVVGVVLATGWLAFWWWHGVHTIAVLLTGLTSGYIISSILFFSPLGNLNYWSREFNYGMSFTVGILIIPVALLYWTKQLSILSCTFLGGYLVCITVDVFVDSGFKNIILNSLRHAAEPNYLSVTVTGPYLTTDIGLTLLWAFFFVGGSIFQLLRERGKPDFPESTWRNRRRSRRLEIEEERQSLLGNGRPTLYGQSGQMVSTQRTEMSLPET